MRTGIINGQAVITSLLNDAYNLKTF